MLQEKLIELSVQQSPPQSRQDMCEDREGIGIERDSAKKVITEAVEGSSCCTEEF